MPGGNVTRCDPQNPGGIISDSRLLAKIGLFLSLAFILGSTLMPVAGGPEPGDFIACLVCGARGWSDAIVNVLLFMPFGAALARLGRTGARPILYGFVLSCLIELTQTVIPGRDPSLGDVTFNTIGMAGGQLAAWLAVRSLLPPSRAAARLSLFSALTALALFLATGYLLRPSLPAGALRAQYTPDLPELEWYDGRVLRAMLGTEAIRPNGRTDPDALRGFMKGEMPLRIDALAGRQVRAFAPLLAILDEGGRGVLLVGPDRDDLVLRYRSRAAGWRLDQPDLRLRHAFASPPLHPRDSLQIAVRQAGRGYCLALDRVEKCDVGYSIGSGWALLYYPRHFPAWAYALLEAGWVAGLAFPVGLWARRRPETVLALVLLGLGLFTPLPGLIQTPAHEVAGAVCGLVLGLMLQAWRRAVSARTG